MATSTPFAVKKDSKENSILSQTNTNDSIAIKRVNFLFFFFLFSIEFEIWISCTMKPNKKSND